MTTTIALAGKGGVGKTTIAAMVIKYLMTAKHGPILAIDADPSSNLNMVLGLELDWTVGDIRENLLEEVRQSLTASGAAMGTLSSGLTKRDYLDHQVRTSVSEGARFDLIAMGRSEGPGCYCAVNHNLRDVIDSISRSYQYVVIDNEAGMEHLSRRTTRDVEILLVITDPSIRGIVAAERIAGFRHHIDININQAYLLVNGLRSETLPEPLLEHIEQLDMPLLGIIPYSDAVSEMDLTGQPLIELGLDTALYRHVAGLMSQII